MPDAKRYIIEHPTRGVYLGFDHSRHTGKWQPKFSWSMPRSDPRVLRYLTIERARQELGKIEEAGVKGCYTAELPSAT